MSPSKSYIYLSPRIVTYTCLKSVVGLESWARLRPGLEEKNQPGSWAVYLLRGRLTFTIKENLLRGKVNKKSRCAAKINKKFATWQNTKTILHCYSLRVNFLTGHLFKKMYSYSLTSKPPSYLLTTLAIRVSFVSFFKWRKTHYHRRVDKVFQCRGTSTELKTVI